MKNHAPAIFDLLKENGIEISPLEFTNEKNEYIVDNLSRRGLISQITNPNALKEEICTKKIGLYCGADPTAASLHVGNLMPLMVLLHFNLRGHNIMGLVGGATGVVGDPSGRDTERSSMEHQIRVNNVSRLKSQMKQFFAFGVQAAEERNGSESALGMVQVRNNIEWWENVTMLSFLGTFGRFIRVNQMLARDSVKSRLSSSQGIGFNEFTYQILQAFDFYHLNANENITAQVGGNDQYGNITAGIDLISRIGSKPAYGLTVPLLTTANGEKFGKSAGNAVFIDKEMTSPYELYQFMMNAADEDVAKLLLKFSLLPVSVIERIVKIHTADPSRRLGQKILALEMCDLVHGPGSGYKNMVVSSCLFGDAHFDASVILESFRSQGRVPKIQASDFGCLIDLLQKLDGRKSRSALKKLIKQAGVTIVGKRGKLHEPTDCVEEGGLLDGRVLILKLGKKDFYIAEVNSTL